MITKLVKREKNHVRPSMGRPAMGIVIGMAIEQSTKFLMVEDIQEGLKCVYLDTRTLAKSTRNHELE